MYEVGNSILFIQELACGRISLLNSSSSPKYIVSILPLSSPLCSIDLSVLCVIDFLNDILQYLEG